ncbi:MAG: glycosyltransferase [Proteobacteria bacterium]|nr:glycosyltransferase [Pseudomonadota bacterium]
MKILHVISSVNPRGGGPIEGLVQLAAINRGKGHEIEVASLDDPQAEWVQRCPLPCHALGPGHIGKYRYSPRLVPWLQAHRQRYDAVIVNGIWQYHAFAAWQALHGTDTPYFVYTHGMLDPWFKRHYPLKHLKKWLFWPWAEYRVLRDAAAVLFTSEDERRLARQSFWLYRCQEIVVNYGTGGPPVADEAAQQQRQAFLERFPQLADTRNLLFLGRLHEKKGVDLLLRALAAVRAQSPAWMQDVRLVIAGPANDDHGQRMQALATQLGLDDITVWTGMVSGPTKWGAFRCADAFVLPSHQENFGISVAEALACGVPVLISRQVNIWREVLASQAGLAEDDTLAGTQALLQQWLAMPRPGWQAMRQRARDCFVARFHIERAAESLIEAMRSRGLRSAPEPGLTGPHAPGSSLHPR